MCLKYNVYILCVLAMQVFSGHQLPGCSLDVVNRDDDNNVPVLFHNYTRHFELIVPQQGVVKLKTGEAITLACTGKRNYISATNSNSTVATCIRGNVLRIIRENLSFDNLKCRKNIRGDVRKTGVKCANDKGQITEIGYQITAHHWVNLITVCYNEDTGVTYYTEHVLHGNDIKYSSKFTNRPSFSVEGLGLNIAASVAYNQAFQKSTFDGLLGSASDAERYINNKSYLARGHLSPAADFLLTTSKRASYYLINTCPQWQIINGGNWKRVEFYIRKTAEKYNTTFTVITGTHGVLSIPVNRTFKSLYLLSQNRLPIPEIIWKILYAQDTQLAIVLIVVNNPFLAGTPQLLCENICEQYDWMMESWNDASRGFVYCCELEAFLEVVRTAPSLNGTGVLRGISH